MLTAAEERRTFKVRSQQPDDTKPGKESAKRFRSTACGARTIQDAIQRAALGGARGHCRMGGAGVMFNTMESKNEH